MSTETLPLMPFDAQPPSPRVVDVQPVETTAEFEGAWRQSHPKSDIAPAELNAMRAAGLQAEHVTYEGQDGKRWTKLSFRTDEATVPKEVTAAPEPIDPLAHLPLARRLSEDVMPIRPRPAKPWDYQPRKTLGGVPLTEDNLFRPPLWTEPPKGRHRGAEESVAVDLAAKHAARRPSLGRSAGNLIARSTAFIQPGSGRRRGIGGGFRTN